MVFASYKPLDTCKWTQNYHRYPAEFIPQLVENLIDEYVSNKNVHINEILTINYETLKEIEKIFNNSEIKI